MAADAGAIDEALVRRLLVQQAPQWSELPIRPVARQGGDNRTFRLGVDKTARLPSHAAYSAQIATEATWLPVLAPHLPVDIPQTLFVGQPTDDFPASWAVRTWIEGDDASTGVISGREAFASDLGRFLGVLQSVDAIGGPPPGDQNFHRGGDPCVYHQQTQDALAMLKLGPRAAAIWAKAMDTRPAAQVWLHGDIAPGNLVVRDGKLSAVIDFGQMAVGDPACDFAIAWTFFNHRERAALRSAANAEDATWERARGWALWKAAAVCAGLSGGARDRPMAQRTIAELLAEP